MEGFALDLFKKGTTFAAEETGLGSLKETWQAFEHDKSLLNLFNASKAAHHSYGKVKPIIDGIGDLAQFLERTSSQQAEDTSVEGEWYAHKQQNQPMTLATLFQPVQGNVEQPGLYSNVTPTQPNFNQPDPDDYVVGSQFSGMFSTMQVYTRPTSIPTNPTTFRNNALAQKFQQQQDNARNLGSAAQQNYINGVLGIPQTTTTTPQQNVGDMTANQLRSQGTPMSTQYLIAKKDRDETYADTHGNNSAAGNLGKKKFGEE